MKIDQLINAIENNEDSYIRDFFMQDEIGAQLDFKNREEILYCSVENGNLNSLRSMIEMGCSVNAKVRSDYMYTLLEFACLCEQESIVEWLLSQGCDLDNDAVIYASAKGQVRIMKMLLKAGADVNRTDFTQRNVLHWAAQEGHAGIIETVLEYGCNIDHQEATGESALYMAVGENRYDIAKLLLTFGADPNLTGCASPFQLACAYRYYPLCDLLLEYNADIDAIDRDGRSALFHAKVVNDDAMMTYLVKNEASTNIIDYYGISYKDLDNEHLRKQIYDDLHGEQEMQ